MDNNLPITKEWLVETQGYFVGNEIRKLFS